MLRMRMEFVARVLAQVLKTVASPLKPTVAMMMQFDKEDNLSFESAVPVESTGKASGVSAASASKGQPLPAAAACPCDRNHSSQSRRSVHFTRQPWMLWKQRARRQEASSGSASTRLSRQLTRLSWQRWWLATSTSPSRNSLAEAEAAPGQATMLCASPRRTSPAGTSQAVCTWSGWSRRSTLLGQNCTKTKIEMPRQSSGRFDL